MGFGQSNAATHLAKRLSTGFDACLRPVPDDVSVLLCFVDESYRGDFYGFAAVIVDEHATKSLGDWLARIVNQASVDYGISTTSEIHGYPLWHGTDDWREVPIRARAAVIGQVVNAVASSDVEILIRGVSRSRLAAHQDRKSYPVRFPPEQICFQHILQRANEIAKRRGHYALIIADDRDDRERHREHFATYQTQGTPGEYMNTNLGQLLDTVHFAPSHRSRMLQAADVLAFLFRRWNTVNETDRRSQQVMGTLRRALRDSEKIRDEGCWP